MLLRFNLQPCSLAKPFNEMVVGFYVHTDMNFIITERKDDEKSAIAHLNDSVKLEANALPGAYEE